MSRRRLGCLLSFQTRRGHSQDQNGLNNNNKNNKIIARPPVKPAHQKLLLAANLGLQQSTSFRDMSSHRQPTSLQVQANRNVSDSSGYPSTAVEDAALLRESRQFRRDMEREAERWVDVLMESPSVDRRFLRRAVSTCAGALRSV